MTDRTYSPEIIRHWGDDIRKMEQLVAAARTSPAPVSDDEYKMVLDPEDFLDLCCGKWHKEQP